MWCLCRCISYSQNIKFIMFVKHIRKTSYSQDTIFSWHVLKSFNNTKIIVAAIKGKNNKKIRKNNALQWLISLLTGGELHLESQKGSNSGAVLSSGKPSVNLRNANSNYTAEWQAVDWDIFAKNSTILSQSLRSNSLLLNLNDILVIF